MSACSSADGSSVALRKHSSVRKSPTPWTGSALAWTALGPSATLASSLTGMPVGRRRGTRPLGQLLAGRPARLDPSLGLGGVAAELDLAGLAVDDQEGAGRDVGDAGRPDHARDAELAGDDRGVAGRAAALGHQRGDQLGVEAGGVAGRQVLGDEHRRLARAWARRARARPRGGRPGDARCPRGR